MRRARSALILTVLFGLMRPAPAQSVNSLPSLGLILKPFTYAR